MSDTRYHLLPEEGRPSTDSVREDERLLGVFGISAPCVPKKSITFTYHPTLLLRLIAVALFIVSFAFHILSGSAPSCAAVAFLSFAITRNIMVLLTHIVRIKVEFGGVREETPGRIKHGKSKIGRFSTKRWPQLIIDFVLLVLLVIMTLIVQFSGMRWSQRYNAIVACIISWVAIPLYFLAMWDMGRPKRIFITSTINFNFGRDEEESQPATSIPENIYRDLDDDAPRVEAEVLQESSKTGVDSP